MITDWSTRISGQHTWSVWKQKRTDWSLRVWGLLDRKVTGLNLIYLRLFCYSGVWDWKQNQFSRLVVIYVHTSCQVIFSFRKPLFGSFIIDKLSWLAAGTCFFFVFFFLKWGRWNMLYRWLWDMLNNIIVQSEFKLFNNITGWSDPK